jgi:hypothetical protein
MLYTRLSTLPSLRNQIYYNYRYSRRCEIWGLVGTYLCGCAASNEYRWDGLCGDGDVLGAWSVLGRVRYAVYWLDSIQVCGLEVNPSVHVFRIMTRRFGESK